MAQLEEILHALNCATNQNPNVLKPAEEWLRSQESDGFFYVSLSEICQRYDIEWSIRWIAVVYLKNGIDKYWRPHSTGSLLPENKARIRSNISNCLEEPVHQIATQFAVAVAKIARFDYPDEWTDLIPLLFSGIFSPRSALHQTRCLLAFTHVIKMLAMKKLPLAKETFSKLCQSIFGNIFQCWISSHESLMQAIHRCAACKGNIDDNTKENHLHLSHIIEHTVREYESGGNSVHTVVLQNLSGMLSLAQQYETSKNLSQICLKTAVITVKILDSLLAKNAESYGFGAKSAVSLLSAQIQAQSTKTYRDEILEKLLVKCMNLLKSIVESDHFFDTFLGKRDDFSSLGPVLERLFQCLVCHYLPLNQEELASWDDDAEDFLNEETTESWKFSLKPCAEILALTLLKKFPDLLVPSLVKMLDAVQDLNTRNISTIMVAANQVLQVVFKGCTTPLECMVRKEAVYFMIGLGIYEVVEAIDFKDWVASKLLPEVEAIQNDAHGKLIHRRVLWLISQWAGVGPCDELKPVLYRFVVASLGKSHNMAVRLAASSTIQYLIDDFELDLTQFKEYQHSCFQGLYDLLMEAKSCDAKMRILNVFTYLIERLGPSVLPYEEEISSIIPLLWDHAVRENHDMLKCMIMATLAQFILVLQGKSNAVHHLVFPLIKQSIDLNNPGHVYLLEDGLDLWLATVQNCDEPNETLFSLFEGIFDLLEYGSETLRICFEIIEAYALFYRGSFVARYGAALDKSFVSMASDVTNECLVFITRVVSTMVNITPENEQMPCLGYFRDALRRVFSDKDCVLLSAIFTLTGQIVLKNLAQFFQQIHLICQEFGGDFSTSVQGLTKIWADSIDSIVETGKKKLSALALLVLASCIPEVPALGHSFPNIVCVVVQVLYDVCDANFADTLLRNDEKPADFDCEQEHGECPHDKRRRLAKKASPAWAVSLPAFASEKLKSVKERLSEQDFLQLMSSVDSGTVTELQDFLLRH